MELLPNSLSFRVISTIDVEADTEIPDGFSGRVRLRTDGVLVYVAWFTDGLLDDPSRRVPAYTRYRSNGRVKYEMHYQRGMLQDPGDGQPAVRGYFANGRVHYEERFRQGRRHDGTGGVPAIRKWRPNGVVRRELHSLHGKPVAPPAPSRAARSA